MACKENNSCLILIKAPIKYQMLLAKKENKDLLYWKADTHWNQYGAYLGYQSLMAEIKKDYPQVSILKENDFEISYQERSEGDLSGKMAALNERYREYKLKDDLSFEYVKDNGTEGIITKNDKKELNMVMFRDSFTISLLPFLSSSFNNCEYIWSSDIKSNLSIVEANKPNIVIIEIVERYTKPANSFDRFDMKGVK
jgi:alginate O-acetyltransferase complex protein AlgJ